MIFARNKKYDEVCGALKDCSDALEKKCAEKEVLYRQMQDALRRWTTANTELEGQKRMTLHFQARCEAYEDAAQEAGMEFVSDEEGFYRLREIRNIVCNKPPEKTFWERLKTWP